MRIPLSASCVAQSPLAHLAILGNIVDYAHFADEEMGAQNC